MTIEELKALSPSEENPIKILQHGYTDLGHTYYAIAIGSDYIILRERYPTGRATVLGQSWLQNYSFPKRMVKKSKDYYVNVYDGDLLFYGTRELAESLALSDKRVIATVKNTVEWQEECKE